MYDVRCGMYDFTLWESRFVPLKSDIKQINLSFKKMGMCKFLLFSLFPLILFSCKDKSCDSFPDISSVDLALDFEDLTPSIHDLETREQMAQFLEANQVLRNYFFKAPQYPGKQQMLNQTWEILSNPYLDSLYRDICQIFDLERLRTELENAYKRIRYFYPGFEPPAVKTVYSGFGRDIYFTDSLLVIGLDYYLGPKAAWRPDEYEYLKVRLTPEHLVPQIMQFTSNRFNKTNPDQRTILDEMLFYGKALQFARQMLPCTHDSLIIGYSGKQMASSERSEGYLWRHFLRNELLYDKQPLNIAKYIGERPNVPEIDRKCPGRIGQWLGWRIVQSYQKETGSDFNTLMTKTEAVKVLMKSRYKPRFR